MITSSGYERDTLWESLYVFEFFVEGQSIAVQVVCWPGPDHVCGPPATPDAWLCREGDQEAFLLIPGICMRLLSERRLFTGRREVKDCTGAVSVSGITGIRLNFAQPCGIRTAIAAPASGGKSANQVWGYSTSAESRANEIPLIPGTAGSRINCSIQI